MNLRRANGRALRIGHRGAAALAPENTLSSLQAAVDHGVDLVEFDVLRDGGAVVLAHSPHELPRDQVTLDQALAFLADAGVGAHVDLKQRGLEADVADALRRHDLVERALVSSLDWAALRDVRAHEPRLAVGISYPDDRYGFSRYRAFAPFVRGGLAGMRRALPRLIGRWVTHAGAAAAVLHYAVLSPKTIERAHALGAAVFAWTVNDGEWARRLEEWGADGIITDDPRIFGPARSNRQ